MTDERVDRGTKPRRIGVAQRRERPAAALDVEHRLAAEQHDERTGDTRGPRTGALRPRKRCAVRLRRIGGGEHERVGVLGTLAQIAQPLDRAAERELRAAETLDEVAAPAQPERLERTQLCVHRAVAAGNPLGADAVARDDPLPFEQELGERTAIGRTAEEALGARPASARSRSGPGRGGGRSGAVDAPASATPNRREARSGVHASFVTSPDHTRSQSAGSASASSRPVSREQLVPEERAAERLAQRVVLGDSGAGAAGTRPSAAASSRK